MGFKNDCKHVLDLETAEGLDKYTISNLSITFINEIKKLTGQSAMIYTYTNFARTRVTSELGVYPLWIAHYGVDARGNNGIWDSWTGFQYTDSGRIGGIDGNVDLDEFTEEVFVDANTLINMEPIQPEPEPEHEDPKIYVVEPGDTLSYIANKFNYPGGCMALAKDNNIPNPDLIYPGQKIKLK